MFSLFVFCFLSCLNDTSFQMLLIGSVDGINKILISIYVDNNLIGPEGQKTRVVMVPSFSETGSIVLVNLGTLECSEICIDV